jgi:hypothetical protein
MGPMQGAPRVRATFTILAGIATGIIFFLGTGVINNPQSWLAKLLLPRPGGYAASRSVTRRRGVADPSTQTEAEQLLGKTIRGDDTARDQLQSRVDRWYGHLTLDPAMTGLITEGLNANNPQVRVATIEVDLAAMGAPRTPQEMDWLETQAASGPQAQRIWALWTIGLLGNRGVDPERAVRILTSYLHDPNVEVRHWAVEGLAYLGADDTIAPLLASMRDDPSQMVRERAACSLAQSGMLSPEQRRTAVPRLIEYAGDGSLDNATHAFAYHALRDITGQNLPDDPAKWRGWQSSQAAN